MPATATMMDKLGLRIDLKSFSIGLGGVVVIYTLLFIYAFLMSGKTIEQLETNLATYISFIEQTDSDVIAETDDDGYHGSAHKEDVHAEPHTDHHNDHAAAPAREVPPVMAHKPSHEPHHKVVHADAHAPSHDAPISHELADNDHQMPHMDAHKTHDKHDDHTDTHAPIPPPDTEDIDLAEVIFGGTSKTTSYSLPPAPTAGLYEDSEYGKLPIISSSTRISPFRSYKKPATVNREKSTIALAVLDFGLSEKLSNQIMARMPSNISLVLSPYSLEPDKWRKNARQDGHEIWLSLPVETADFPRRDPGPKALMNNVSLAYNQERLGWALGRTVGYAGIASFTDEALEDSSPMFKDLIKELFTRGLGFLELNENSDNFVSELANKSRGVYTKSHASIKIFSEQNKDLAALEAHIMSHPQTVIVVRPAPKTLDTLSRWLEKMEQRGVALAPVSAVAALSAE